MYLTEAQQQCHQRLLHGNMERIEFKYLKAVRAGIESPAIVVFELRDEATTSCLELHHAEIEQQIAYAKVHGLMPTAIWHGPSFVAAKRLDPSLPEKEWLIQGSWRAGFFPVVICGAGASSLKMLEIPVE